MRTFVLLLALMAAGFAVEAILLFNRASRPGWWFNGSVLKRRTLGRLQLRNFDRLVWLWRRVDRYLPWPQTSLIGIGRKGPLPQLAAPGSLNREVGSSIR